MAWTATLSEIAPTTTVAVMKGELVLKSSASGNMRDGTLVYGRGELPLRGGQGLRPHPQGGDLTLGPSDQRRHEEVTI